MQAEPQEPDGLPRRVNELERMYEAEHADTQNLERLDELRFTLSGLVGKNNLRLLREYTDRVIAQYSTEPDWFYQKGLEDALRMVTGTKENFSQTPS